MFIESEIIIENHPLSCYTSRKFDYSTKLNEILMQNESLGIFDFVYVCIYISLLLVLIYINFKEICRIHGVRK
jgi:hypothetical protein